MRFDPLRPKQSQKRLLREAHRFCHPYQGEVMSVNTFVGL